MVKIVLRKNDYVYIESEGRKNEYILIKVGARNILYSKRVKNLTIQQ